MRFIYNKLAALGRVISDLIWPPICAGCGASLPLSDKPDHRSFYCRACLETIEFMPDTFCPLCGRPYWGAPAHLCGDCLINPPPYSTARSAVIYGGEAAHCLLKLKYHGDLKQAAALASLCHENQRLMDAETGFIIPMPLTAERERQRGFNQALELAAAIYGARAPIHARVLERTRDGHRNLASLSAKERRAAIKGCFAVREPGLIKGAKILLFDDILTTGATAGEAARTLLAAGAASVELKTVARTVPSDWR